MKKDLELWQFIAKCLKNGEKVMLLVVVESVGSSPGRQGFKMAVGTEGSLFGSIGGGIMEIKLVELAKSHLQNNVATSSDKTTRYNTPFLKKQIHNKNAAHDQSGMICSGEQTILFYPLEKTHLTTVKKIVSALENNTLAVLKWDAQYFELFDNQRLTDNFTFVFADIDTFVYVENLGFKQQLYIIGGGHCALALSELMAKMDFQIHLFDDRLDLNTLQKNTFAHCIETANYATIGDKIPSGPDVYVVVMTVGYRTDAVVIRQLLDKNIRYLGVLGSASKMKTLLQLLENEGFNSDILRGIHTPIGVAINSRTPEEIAVSIAAEIIFIKNK